MRPTRPSTQAAKLAVNPELRRYVQDSLAGSLQRPAESVAGPPVGWRGRRQGLRRTGAGGPSWSPEQISGRLRTAPAPHRRSFQPARRAIVAVARKLAVLFWHLLIAEKDYAFARPALTAHKLRELEFRAGAQRRVGSRSLKHKSGDHQQHNRDREREIATQAELAYSRLVTDRKPTNPRKAAAVT